MVCAGVDAWPLDVLVQIVDEALALEAVADRGERKRTLSLVARGWSEAVIQVGRRNVSASTEDALARLAVVLQKPGRAALVRRLALYIDETSCFVNGVAMSDALSTVARVRTSIRTIDITFMRPGSEQFGEFWRFGRALQSLPHLCELTCDLRGVFHRVDELGALLAKPTLRRFAVPDLLVKWVDGGVEVERFGCDIVHLRHRDGRGPERASHQGIAGLQHVLPLPLRKLTLDGFLGANESGYIAMRPELHLREVTMLVPACPVVEPRFSSLRRFLDPFPNVDVIRYRILAPTGQGPVSFHAGLGTLPLMRQFVGRAIFELDQPDGPTYEMPVSPMMASITARAERIQVELGRGIELVSGPSHDPAGAWERWTDEEIAAVPGLTFVGR